MIKIKTPQQIALMRSAGVNLRRVLDQAKEMVVPGVTTQEIDQAIYQAILRTGDRPAFLNYEGFPKSSCISVNEEVIHAIPGERVLEEGDIVTIDVGLWHDQVCVDAARTWPVGTADQDSTRLIATTEAALQAGVAAARAGSHVGQISAAIEDVAKRAHLGVIRHFTGHGVGLALHEEPSIPNYGRPGDGAVLKAGMTLALEPMLALGNDEVTTLADGWTVVMADGKRAAQIEHTILVTGNEAEILV